SCGIDGTVSHQSAAGDGRCGHADRRAPYSRPNPRESHLMSDIDNAISVERAANVRLMIFDVDGVLTDGSLHFGPEGEVLKTFNVLDGHGIKMLQQAGIATAVISARQSPSVTRRAADLGIMHVYQGVHDKRVAFEELLAD